MAVTSGRLPSRRRVHDFCRLAFLIDSCASHCIHPHPVEHIPEHNAGGTDDDKFIAPTGHSRLCRDHTRG